jgi:hypothetical protein
MVPDNLRELPLLLLRLPPAPAKPTAALQPSSFSAAPASSGATPPPPLPLPDAISFRCLRRTQNTTSKMTVKSASVPETDATTIPPSVIPPFAAAVVVVAAAAADAEEVREAAVLASEAIALVAVGTAVDDGKAEVKVSTGLAVIVVVDVESASDVFGAREDIVNCSEDDSWDELDGGSVVAVERTVLKLLVSLLSAEDDELGRSRSVDWVLREVVDEAELLAAALRVVVVRLWLRVDWVASCAACECWSFVRLPPVWEARDDFGGSSVVVGCSVADADGCGSAYILTPIDTGCGASGSSFSCLGRITLLRGRRMCAIVSLEAPAWLPAPARADDCIVDALSDGQWNTATESRFSQAQQHQKA